MKSTLLAWLWHWAVWRVFCVYFVHYCPFDRPSSWVFYHTGLGEQLADLMTDQGHFNLAIQFRREVTRVQARYEGEES